MNNKQQRTPAAAAKLLAARAVLPRAAPQREVRQRGDAAEVRREHADDLLAFVMIVVCWFVWQS